MDYFTVILLGILQGITEFLPVSSSGHLVIAGELLSQSGHSAANLKSIEVNIALHIGTLFSILVVYRQRLRDVLRQPRLMLAIVIATAPLVPIGLLFKDAIDRMFDSVIDAGYTLCLTALLMALARLVERGERPLEEVRGRDALLIGLFQAAAILPGLSRSGATIFGGLLSGLKRDAAANFSFYIAVPALLGAAVLHAKDLWEHGAGDVGAGPLLAGGLTAFIVGVISLEGLLRLVTRQKLHWFAWYCGVVGVATVVWQLSQ